MPSRHTFTIKPIESLLERLVSPSCLSVDPFCGHHSPATVTNDLNPEIDANFHVHAAEFAKKFDDCSIDVLLFDPPYSPRQISECYKSIGLAVTMETTQNARLYADVRNAFAPKIAVGGVAISFGWNSSGFGEKRGFELIEVMLVAHGAAHNDAIVTVERKTQ